MVDQLRGTGAGRIDPLRLNGLQKGAPAAKAAAPKPGAGVAATASPAAAMAAEGPPVDAARVAEIKAAIAEGRYPVDPQLIAERMIDLDLPGLK